MRSSVRLLCSLAFVGSRADAQAPAATHFDLSGTVAFWRVYDVLARNEEPPDPLWDALWRTPGYALLDAKEQRRATLTHVIRLAVRPSLRDSIAPVIARGGWTGSALTQLRDIGAARDRLTEFERQLQSDSLVLAARARARAWLPPGALDRSSGPPIAFIYFQNARGYPEGILLDPLHFMRMTNRAEVLGHELHHHYRQRLERPMRDFGDDLLAWTLSTVESEGIAGMVDKRDVPSLSSERLHARYPEAASFRYFTDYQTEYRDSARRLRQVEDVLARITVHPDSLAPLGRWLHDELPDNGRIMGAFMAETIDRVLGRERLVNTVGDPFMFWRAYREAALRSAGQTYAPSEASMRAIGEVEQRYRLR